MDFRLGEWWVEPSLNRLSHEGSSVRLEPKVMELLVLLASRPNEVLTKEEILEHLWPETYVTESSLFRHVSELRRALGDDRKHPRFLQTIPKRGYRLLLTPPMAMEMDETKAPAGSPRGHLSRFRLGAIAGVAPVAAAALFFVFHTTAKPKLDEEAKRAYLRGELFENRVDCRSFDRAIESYREATERERGFVEAYPRLFDALVASAVLGCQPASPLFTELESLLEVARRNGLDETRRGQGRAALTLWRDRNVASALEAFHRAAERGSAKDTEDLSYAVTLVVSGRPEDGIREAKRCLDALPVDLGENWAFGGILYLTGRFDEAIEQFEKTLELYPGYRPAEQLLALSYWMAGDRERALSAAEKAEPFPGEPLQRFDAVPGYVYALSGDRDRAETILAQWTERASTEWVPKTSLALLHLGLGEREEALRWLEQARREEDPWVVVAAADPAFRPLWPLATSRNDGSMSLLRSP